MTYDDAGNMLTRKKYSYTTGTLGSVLSTQTLTYGNATWGDLLTGINGTTVTSDAIGNILNDGTWTYTWKNGRQLTTMSKSGVTWSFAYDASGMRTQRVSGSTTYTYTYDDSTLVRMTVGSNTLIFTYGANGHPMTVKYNGVDYYYITNSQGDVVSILNSSGAEVVTYTYDAWGNILSISGSMASTLGTHNPLRYRGYVYDEGLGLYYLQSRYYNPELCRFINADTYVSTGQGILGYNMFAYCNNNPANFIDNSGTAAISVCNGDRNPLFIGYIGLGGCGGAGGMLVCAGIAIYTAITEAVPFKPAQKAEEKEAEIAVPSTSSPTVIYRYYASKTENLSPRIGKDYDGLSFSTKPPRPGVSAVVTTIEQVNATGILTAIPTGGTHILIIPKFGTVEQWMIQGQSSIWSQVLSLIVVEWEGG